MQVYIAAAQLRVATAGLLVGLRGEHRSRLKRIMFCTEICQTKVVQTH